jgi:ribonuclease HI
LASHTKAGAVENVDKGYKNRNTYIYSMCHSETAIKALDNYQMKPKLAESNRVQLVRVPAQGGIEGNEIADQLARVRPERSGP